jgi:minichromosome maintenance protein 10
LGTSAARTPKTAAFDPERKWGLLPANGSNSTAGPSRSGGGATYIISGRVISNRPEYVNEKLGRSRAERQKRKREEEAGEAVLDKLLSRDGGRTVGAIAIEKAREARKGNTGPSKEAAGTKDVRKAAYPAEALKRIGFDPTLKAGDQGQIRDRDGKKRVGCSMPSSL